MASKDFGAIEDEYAFFVSHTTEAESDLAEFARELAGFAEPRETVRMLDFGCGAGDFTERLLAALAWPAPAVELTLVEPVRHQREQAARRLARFSGQAIAHADRLRDADTSPFDLILCNHVLYYVDDLAGTLRRFLQLRSATGMILLAIAGRDNVLFRFWQLGFASIDRPIPYHTAEDVEAVLSRLGVRYRKKECAYRLGFPDSVGNRQKMLRFLLGEHLDAMPLSALVAEFDNLVVGDQILAESHCFHFVIDR